MEFLTAATQVLGGLAGGGAPAPPSYAMTDGGDNTINVGGFNVPDYQASNTKTIKAALVAVVALVVVVALAKK